MLQTATPNAAGVASIEVPVAQAGTYLYRVVNVGVGPVSVWTAVTPLVSRQETNRQTVFGRRAAPDTVADPPREALLLSRSGEIDSAPREGPVSEISVDRVQLIRRYEEGPAKLREAFAKVPREAWKWRPGPAKWSAQEIVCHCADAEVNAAARIRYLVAEEKPMILGYDQDRWARTFDYHSARVELAMSTVDVVRANTAHLLRRLPESAWSATGTHTESGPYGAMDWLQTYAEHLEKHSRQIERTLSQWRQEETRPGIRPGS